MNKNFLEGYSMNNTAVNVFENKVRLKKVESNCKEKGDLAFSPLLFYLQDGFLSDLNNLKRETSNLLSLGLSNLDNTFNGGLSPGVHVIAGKAGAERSSFMVHLLDHFARQKFACIYLSEQENKSSFIMKMLMRNHFIQDRNTPLTANQLVEKLASDSLFFETSLEQISNTAKFLSIENKLPEDLSHLEERMKYQKKKCERTVLIVDVADVYNLDAKKDMIDRLKTIAQELQIRIIVDLDLNENDFNNAKNGYATTTKIESAVDSFTFFSRSNSTDVSTTYDFYSPYLIELTLRNNKSFSQLNKTFLTYYPQSFYFQDA